MGKLRKLLELPPATVLMLVRAAAVLVMVDLALRLLPFRRCQAFAAGTRTPARTRVALGESHTRVTWAVGVAAGLIKRACLTQALGLQWFLSRHGVSTRLCLGVRRQDPGGSEAPQGAFRAHAWLESDGRILIGGPAAATEGYAPLACFESFGAGAQPSSGEPVLGRRRLIEK